MPVTEIDWDNMFDSYPYSKEYTKEQEDAISTLMLLCGTSLEMDYYYQSGAVLGMTAGALRRYFDYDDFVEVVGCRDSELEDWEDIIYEELGNGRPVLHNASWGHAFIVDGYNNGYFHVNWGWGGGKLIEGELWTESYYLLTDIGYDNYNYAVIGIQPSKAHAYAVLDEGKVTLYYDQEIDNRQGMVIPHVSTCYDITEEIREKITECVIDKSYSNIKSRNLEGFFAGCTALKSIRGIENLITDNVMDMSRMFDGCSALTSLDVSGFKTDNVTNMFRMFSGCSGLTSLDVSGFKTDKVRDMGEMFKGCSGLTSLDVSGFKTDKVRDMGEMFDGCSGLTSLDVSGFKTDNVTSMSGMFDFSSLTTIYASEGWNTANVDYQYADMFVCCYNLVGGAGTKYSINHTGLDYAHIDGGPDNPGYLTYKAPSQKQKKGDVNGDGKVNGTDIQTVINVIVDEDYVEEADVNNDNKVNGTDIQEIINIIVEEE